MLQGQKNLAIPGRDRLISWLREESLLVKTKIRRCSTTDSSHHYHKYNNLIRDFVPYRRNQLWVTDITYLQTQGGFIYLNLITDAYSRKIIGWRLAPTLEAKYSIQALNMAIDNAEEDLDNRDCTIFCVNRKSKKNTFLFDFGRFISSLIVFLQLILIRILNLYKCLCQNL